MNDNYTILVCSLENLSKAYEEQINSFPEFVDVFDEVISDFDNAFHLLPLLMDENLIPYKAVTEIIRCNNLIELNLSIEERKTDESFRDGEVWNLVREYASNAVALLKKNF